MTSVQIDAETEARLLPFFDAARVVCIDIETTGLNPEGGAIVEVGFAAINRWGSGAGDFGGWTCPIAAGTGTDAGAALVHPGMPIPAEATKVHGITDAMVADAPPRDRAVSCVIGRALRDSFVPFVLAAHNAAFETAWLTAEETAGRPFLCTLKLARVVWPEASSHSLQNLLAWRQPAGVERAVPAHRALGDAIGTALILREILNVGMTIPEALRISAAPLRQRRGAA